MVSWRAGVLPSSREERAHSGGASGANVASSILRNVKPGCNCCVSALEERMSDGG